MAKVRVNFPAIFISIWHQSIVEIAGYQPLLKEIREILASLVNQWVVVKCVSKLFKL
jgi:hypothetical protein